MATSYILRPSGVVVCLVCLVISARASAEAYYYQKYGVDQQAFVTDVMECNSLASPVKTPKIYTPYQSNLYAAAISGFMMGWMKGAERRRMQRSVERTCMADKGYVRIEASKEISRELGSLKDEEKLNRLHALATEEHPSGKRLPE